MKEINRHSLYNAIIELPAVTPPKGLWNNIEADLVVFPISELPAIKPPPDLWNKIETTMATSQSFPIKKKAIISFLLLLFVSFSGYIGYDTYQNNFHKTPLTEKSIVGISDETKEHGEQNNLYTTENTQRDNTNHLSIINRLPNKDIHLQPAIAVTDDFVLQIDYINNTTTALTHYINKTQVTDLKYRYGHINTENSKLHIPTRGNTECSSFTGSTIDYFVGIQGNYYLFTNGDKFDNTTIKNWWQTSIIAGFTNNKYSLTTGIGIALSSDETKSEFSYLQNELVNTYEYVDSVYFDPVTGTTHFVTTTVEVYDSIEYSGKANVKCNYSYLLIPLFAEFTVLSTNNFKLILQGNISYYHLSETRKAIPNLYHKDSRILSSDFYTPKRNTDIVKFGVGALINYSVTRDADIYFNPGIGIFNKSVFENDDDNNPVIVHLGAGIRINL